MKLYRSKIEPLAKDILGTLNAARDIEVAPDRVGDGEAPGAAHVGRKIQHVLGK